MADEKEFICPVCGGREYGVRGIGGSMTQFMYCKGCTAIFVDPDKFTAAAQRPERLAGIFFQSAASGFKELIGVLRRIESDLLIK